MGSLLFISQRLPYPPNKGEKLRAFNQIKALSAHYDVTVVSNVFSKAEQQSAEELKKYCADVWTLKRSKFGALVCAAASMLAGRSATQGYFAAKGLQKLIRRRSRGKNFDIVFAYCSGVLPTLLGCEANSGKIIDLVDADSAKWLAYSQASGLFKRIIYHLENQRIERLEQKALSTCDAVIVSADSEADILCYDKQWDNLYVIANGVDSDYFAYSEPNFEPNIIFTGTMDYQPNIDAVNWLAEEVWPTIINQNRSAKFIIAGRNPAPEVKALANREGIIVTGELDDIRPELSKAAIAVVPLKIARGIQNKILEAMSAGPVVVTSPQAIAGIEALHNRDCVCAIEPEQWVNSINTLFYDGRLRKMLSENARQLVMDNYSWQGRLQIMIDICLNLSQNEPNKDDADSGDID